MRPETITITIASIISARFSFLLSRARFALLFLRLAMRINSEGPPRRVPRGNDSARDSSVSSLLITSHELITFFGVVCRDHNRPLFSGLATQNPILTSGTGGLNPNSKVHPEARYHCSIIGGTFDYAVGDAVSRACDVFSGISSSSSKVSSVLLPS